MILLFYLHGKLDVRVSCIDIIKKFFSFKAMYIKNWKNIIYISSVVGWWSPLKVFKPEFLKILVTLVLSRDHIDNLFIISTLKVSSFWKNVYNSGKIQTWYNAFKCFLINFMKRGCQLEKGIWNCYLKLSHT